MELQKQSNLWKNAGDSSTVDARVNDDEVLSCATDNEFDQGMEGDSPTTIAKEYPITST